MWESPIKQFTTEMQMTYENECMEVVQGFGFDVDKEELIKALQYDRNQFDKGYKDGYAKAIEEFSERLKKRYPIMENDLFTINDTLHREIDKIAEQLKGGAE